jgi:hypothetical protein
MRGNALLRFYWADPCLRPNQYVLQGVFGIFMRG